MKNSIGEFLMKKVFCVCVGHCGIWSGVWSDSATQNVGERERERERLTKPKRERLTEPKKIERDWQNQRR